MQTTMELLRNYSCGDSDYVIADRLNVSRTTITMARKRQRLSPELAAKIAGAMELDVPTWTAIAAAEQMQEPTKSYVLGKIAAALLLAGATVAGAAPLQGNATEPLCIMSTK